MVPGVVPLPPESAADGSPDSTPDRDGRVVTALNRAGDSGVLRSHWAGPVKRRATCPHCWTRFHLGDVLWVARHESQRGDPVAGSEAMRRFLPTRFDARGHAIDAGGLTCTDLACPHCRLPIARALLEAAQLYFSLVGVPASGKSYLTAAMSWRLRELLPARFGMGFSDVDPAGNALLIANEQTLFLRDHPEEPVSLEKTQMQGAHYDAVRFGEQTASLAHPFQFLMSPVPGRSGIGDGRADADTPRPRVINFYDNAGEHFLPGNDTALTPGTQHVARANALFFLFDPLQDPRCRSKLSGHTEDPQIAQDFAGGVRQDTILNEMGQRIRRYAQLDATAILDQPLIVLVSKADAWLELAGLWWGDQPEPVLVDAQGRGAVDTALIERVSEAVRGWLSSITPEFVSLADGLHRTVMYLPVSALGGPPQRSGPAGRLMVRPDKIAPRWVAAPMLYALSKWGRGALPSANAGGHKSGTEIR